MSFVQTRTSIYPKMKKLLAIIAATLASCATFAAVESVNLKIRPLSGATYTQTRALTKVDTNVYRLQIPKEELKDLYEISILTNDGTVPVGTDGYFVLGDGRCGDFLYQLPEGKDESTRQKKLTERRNPMPLYGVKRGNNAFLAIVKGLKYEFSMIVEVKNGNYEVYPLFHVKVTSQQNGMGFGPYEDLIIDFYNLSGADANYSKMGRIYREYQLGIGEVKPLRERVKNNPELAYSADTMFVRIRNGTKVNYESYPEDQTLENEPKISVAYTFDQFMEIMTDFKSRGIEKVEMCFVGWHAGGFDGRYPDLFPIPEEFGGEVKFKEAIDKAHELGYQIVCHVCNHDFYKIATRWSEDLLVKRHDGSLRPYSFLPGGRAYNPCFAAVRDVIVPQDYKRLSELGIKGTFHIDVTSCVVPYECHDPKHPCNRQQTADAQNDIGTMADNTFGGFGSEGPCDHVAKTLDYVLYVWAYPSYLGAKNDLVQKLVPIWQIAYHGIILSNPHYATIDYNLEGARGHSPYNFWMDSKFRRLKLYEFGGRPTFYFAGYNATNRALIKEAYDEYQNAKYLQYEYMDEHKEIAPNVFLTLYSDGSKVITNYTDTEYTYEGNTIGALDYKIIKP